jgi:putative Mn2+ efflux pump MntP
MLSWSTWVASGVLALLGLTLVIVSFDTEPTEVVTLKWAYTNLGLVLAFTSSLGFQVAVALGRSSVRIRQLEQRVQDLERRQQPKAGATPATQR